MILVNKPTNNLGSQEFYLPREERLVPELVVILISLVRARDKPRLLRSRASNETLLKPLKPQSHHNNNDVSFSGQSQKAIHQVKKVETRQESFVYRLRVYN